MPRSGYTLATCSSETDHSEAPVASHLRRGVARGRGNGVRRGLRVLVGSVSVLAVVCATWGCICLLEGRMRSQLRHRARGEAAPMYSLGAALLTVSATMFLLLGRG